MSVISVMSPSNFKKTGRKLAPGTELTLETKLLPTTSGDGDRMLIGDYMCDGGCKHFINPGARLKYYGGPLQTIEDGKLVEAHLPGDKIVTVLYFGKMPIMSHSSQDPRGKVVRPRDDGLPDEYKEIIDPGTLAFLGPKGFRTFFFPIAPRYGKDQAFDFLYTGHQVDRKSIAPHMRGYLRSDFNN